MLAVLDSQVRPRHVALRTHGDDRLRRRLAGWVLELGPQAGNVHVDGPRFDALRADAPDACQQLLARNGPRVVGNEEAEDRRLGFRQLAALFFRPADLAA